MDDKWGAVIAAVVAGLFVLASAVLSFAASRSEPRAVKELKALNEVLDAMPEGPARDSLVERRDRIALRYGRAGAETMTGSDRLFMAGSIFLLLGFVGMELLTGGAGMTTWLPAAGGVFTASFFLAGLTYIVIAVVMWCVSLARHWRAYRADRKSA